VTVHVVTASSFADAAPQVAAVTAPDDLVLIHPAAHALVAGDGRDIEHAYEPFKGAVAVAAALDRHHPVTPALCGPAAAVNALLRDIDGRAENDTAALIAVADGGVHDLVLDAGRQVFAVLDGTGTDVVAVGGRLHAGGERPVVVIDPTDGSCLAGVRAALDDPASNDLAALLRYEATTGPSERAEVVAADILVMPFWTPAFCATVVRAAEAAGVWSSDPDDPVPGAEVSLFSISPRLVALLDDDLQTRAWPRWREHWSEVAATQIADAFVIRYEAGGDADHLPLHHDVAQVSATVRLNEGYDGGALSFPRQQWDNAAVPVGHLTAWPSLVTHPHRAEPVTRGVKYGLTIWLAIPE
jgi:hypothetical protein